MGQLCQNLIGIEVSLPDIGLRDVEVEIDRFDMLIKSQYGRPQYTCFTKVVLGGVDGKNYGIPKYGSFYATTAWPSTGFHECTNQLNGITQTHNNLNFLSFNEIGDKGLSWKSKVGPVRIKFFMFCVGHFMKECMMDLPKTVQFTLMLSGEIVKRFHHTYSYEKCKRPLSQGQPLEIVSFDAPINLDETKKLELFSSYYPKTPLAPPFKDWDRNPANVGERRKLVDIDEFEMKIESQYGRTQYTCFMKVVLEGEDGKNYGGTEFGTWLASSAWPSTSHHDCSRCLNGEVQWHNSLNFLSFNESGTKILRWKSKVGEVKIKKFLFHVGHFMEECMNDLPKKVVFTLRLKSDIVKRFEHEYTYEGCKPYHQGKPLEEVTF